MRRRFNGAIEVEWIDINDREPLEEGKFNEWNCGIVASCFVLINDEEDRNDDPSLVQIEFLRDHDGSGQWQFVCGTPYHECHAKNIRYWCYVPEYYKHSVEDYTKPDNRPRISEIHKDPKFYVVKQSSKNNIEIISKAFKYHVDALYLERDLKEREPNTDYFTIRKF